MAMLWALFPLAAPKLPAAKLLLFVPFAFAASPRAVFELGTELPAFAFAPIAVLNAEFPEAKDKLPTAVFWLELPTAVDNAPNAAFAPPMPPALAPGPQAKLANDSPDAA